MTDPAYTVRPLSETDAAALRAIRLAALQESPEAFGSSHEEEKDLTIADFAGWVARGYIAGAFREGALVGTAGFYVQKSTKTAHRGGIWGVFVDPDHRGHGIARLLIENVLAHAAPRVLQIHLSVVTDNAAAIALYRRLGFSIYGTEPRSLRLGARFFDEHLMVKRLDADRQPRERDGNRVS